MIRIGINGFGRIGRQALKAIIERYGDSLQVVAINDLFDVETNAHLFKYDTCYGRYAGTVNQEDDYLLVDHYRIKNFSVRDPAAIPWEEEGVEIVIESTGLFTTRSKAAAHMEGGAKKGDHHGPGEGGRHHHRHGGKPWILCARKTSHHLQCLLHDELSRTPRLGHSPRFWY